MAVFDWIDPTDEPVDYPVLQPLLLASRRSCNQQGNWYLQPGDHSFHFSVTSHKNDWRSNFHSSVGAAQPMPVVVDPARTGSQLPESLSFFSVDQANALISTIKKSENSQHAVLRLYDIAGRATNVQLNSFFQLNGLEPTSLIEEATSMHPATVGVENIKLDPYSIKTWKMIAE